MGQGLWHVAKGSGFWGGTEHSWLAGWGTVLSCAGAAQASCSMLLPLLSCRVCQPSVPAERPWCGILGHTQLRPVHLPRVPILASLSRCTLGLVPPCSLVRARAG